MKLRKRRRKDKGAPKWMVTYADMVTLILVFFILLFSMSQIDLEKFEALAESFRSSKIFEQSPSPIPMENPAENTDNKQSGLQMNESDEKMDEQDSSEQEKADSTDDLMRQVTAFLDKNDLNNVITANQTDDGVVLILQEKVLFESGEADIIDDGEVLLDKVDILLSNISNAVRIEGHTDNRPISNYRFPSNWELSAARASRVVRYLINNGDVEKERFSAAGYGDTRPLVPNDSSANWAKNRRVEIVLLQETDE
ncbi:flagellar motor protein MotS [Sediminibacillus halophilus]|uniref:Chemotaxis protein MotB n=1 Tax=Sediminibacillus halophilus TaxID=482461 RepID=A0A1G9Y4M6_9BACI|nr:flagellar motor protein MotS [Sediminibacillus halophilus]SDN04039.1 chemotaxis protein MotB [Sediminibacillus halophilus]